MDRADRQGVDLARSLERACFDHVLIEDSSYIGKSCGGSNAIDIGLPPLG